MNNFYQQSMFPQNISYSNNQLIRVTGIDGAKAYQMYPNSTVALFDNNEDLMYIKTTDGAGFPTIRTFRFAEETQTNNKTILDNDYVSKKEFEDFKKEMKDYAEQFIQSKPNATDKSANKSKYNTTADAVCE